MQLSRESNLITVRVKPRASRSGVEVGVDGALAVRVHAAATEGAANREAISVLSDALGVPKSTLEIVKGHTSRQKRVSVGGLSADEALSRLRQAAQERGRSE
jgi:uncharacterized protein (TIGR00251 family)